MIERDEMLRLVRRERDEAENGYAVSQHGSEAVTVWRRRADVLLAIESFIRTAPDPEDVRRLVEAAEEMTRTICDLCRRINPQHADCESCQDMEGYRSALALFKGGK